MLTGYELTLACLALNIYHEAAFEPLQAQFAVAFVTINRAKQTDADMCKVVFKSKQFSWTINARDSKGKLLPKFQPTDNPRWRTANEIAKVAISGDLLDFTGGATHFHAAYIRKPIWTKKLTFVGRYGTHLFYR